MALAEAEGLERLGLEVAGLVRLWKYVQKVKTRTR